MKDSDYMLVYLCDDWNRGWIIVPKEPEKETSKEPEKEDE